MHKRSETLPQVPTAGFILGCGADGVYQVRSASTALFQLLDHGEVEAAQLWDVLSLQVHPEDRREFDAAFAEPDTERDTCWQGRLVSNGKPRVVSITLQPVGSLTPEATWIGVLLDLTDILDLDIRFSSVLDAAQAYTWRRDIRSGRAEFGSRWARFAYHGEGETSVSVDDWLAKVHPDHAFEVRAQVEALERGEVNNCTLLYRRQLQDASWVWLRVHAGISERDETGAPTALSGVSFDVTAEMEERARALNENRALRAELVDVQTALQRTAYELTENIPIGTYTMALEPGDELAQFRFMSSRFLEITGLDAETARADPLRAFECVHPDDYDDWVQMNAHAFVHRKPFREETRLLVDGQVRWIVAESIPRLTDDGRWIWEGVIQDITDQKISEQALRRANQNLRDAASEKARAAERAALLQDIHDGFGNTLAIGKMRLRGGDAPATEAVEVIEDCLADLRILINSLDAEGESLWSVLGSLLERIAARARHLSLDLTWDLDASRSIYLRPRQMLQAARIVQEAVANAIRHSGAQAIHVAVTGGEQDGTGQIAIHDNGQGFDTDSPRRGRGLENMRQRAKSEGWKLQFQSGPDGKGTLVTLSLSKD